MARQTLCILLSWLILGVAGHLHVLDARVAPLVVSDKFELDHKGQRVIRRAGSGKVVWSSRLDGYLGLVRPPHLLHDEARVYVTHQDGVTALDAKSGKVVWRSKGPADHLFLSGELLLEVDCENLDDAPPRDRLLLARSTGNGKEAFRTRLPRKDFEPNPIRELAGLFVIQDFGGLRNQVNTLLIDRKGKVCHRLRDLLADARPEGNDLVLLTNREVVRVSSDGVKRWAVAFRKAEWQVGGQLVKLPGGDLLAFLFGPISDSGVQLVRLQPGSGMVVWRGECARLGVTHSAYAHHVDLQVEGDRVKVTSRASGGSFVEILDVKSGKHLKRTRR
jgi:hypothetical protein